MWGNSIHRSSFPQPSCNYWHVSFPSHPAVCMQPLPPSSLRCLRLVRSKPLRIVTHGRHEPGRVPWNYSEILLTTLAVAPVTDTTLWRPSGTVCVQLYIFWTLSQKGSKSWASRCGRLYPGKSVSKANWVGMWKRWQRAEHFYQYRQLIT